MSEIIIDGVNVAECEYSCVCLTDDSQERIACNSSCHNKNTKYSVCVYNPNCYYKQLKRLQAENKRLNSICLQLQSSESKQHLEKVNCERENYKLHKENEQLKKRQITKNGFICDCEQNVKYKQALEEIRDIVKRNEWIYQELLPTHIYENTMQIQTKISEVLDERNN